jgi:hypothetical protein
LAQALSNTDPTLSPAEYLRECDVNYVRFAIDNTDAFFADVHPRTAAVDGALIDLCARLPAAGKRHR